MSLRRVGIDLKNDGTGHQLTASDLLSCGQLAERYGFDSVWLNEDVGHDSIALLSVLSQQTRSIGLGTAIVNVYNRSALQVAMGIATLDELSGGRAVLGVSVGHHPWNDLGHGIPREAPLARLRESITFIKKALTGERFTHDGRFFRGVDTRLAFRPPRADLPVYGAGERPKIIKVVAETADGLIMNVLPLEYIANYGAEHFRSCARSAGRNPNDLELMAVVTCCVSEDRREALSHARQTFVTRLRSQPERLIELMPSRFHEELISLKGLIDRGERAEAECQVSEEIVTSIIAVGSAPEVCVQIERYFAAGCTRVALAAYPREREHVEAMMTALSPAIRESVA